MSGTRQHFLPRFLLKGFASTIQGDIVRTWVSRRGTPPFETNVINIGTESKFYTAEDNTELDDLITKMESKFAQVINKYRGCTSDRKLVDPELPELITHLIVRTKYLRDSFYRSTSYFVEVLLAALNEPDVLEHMILNYIRSHPEEILKDFESSLSGYHLNKRQKTALIKNILKLTPVLLRDQQPEVMLYVRILKESLRNQLPELIKNSHIQSLNGLTPCSWTD